MVVARGEKTIILMMERTGDEEETKKETEITTVTTNPAITAIAETKEIVPATIETAKEMLLAIATRRNPHRIGEIAQSPGIAIMREGTETEIMIEETEKKIMNEETETGEIVVTMVTSLLVGGIEVEMEDIGLRVDRCEDEYIGYYFLLKKRNAIESFILTLSLLSCYFVYGRPLLLVCNDVA